MKKIYIIGIILFVIVAGFIYFAVSRDNTVVQDLVISNEKCEDADSIDDMEEPDSYTAGKELYANIYFIESPKGTEYTLKWYRNDTEVYSSKLEMQEDRKGLLIFNIEGSIVTEGSWKIEVINRDKVVYTKEFTVVK